MILHLDDDHFGPERFPHEDTYDPDTKGFDGPEGVDTNEYEQSIQTED